MLLDRRQLLIRPGGDQHPKEITHTHKIYSKQSRHTVVCRAAQEAGAQPREYIDRKKENAIFAPP